MKKSIVVLTAEHYSGKTTFTEIAQKIYPNECQIHQARPVIEESLRFQNIEINRKNIRDQSQRLLEISTEEGYDSISVSFMEKIDSSDRNLHVIDSVYHPCQIRNWRKWCIQKKYQVIEVAIIASFEKRLFLAQKRHKDFSKEDLCLVDELERTGKINGQQVDECITMATSKIFNNSSYDQYVRDIEIFLRGD